MMQRPLLALLLVAPLAACVSFGAKPPPSLMTLTPAAAPAADQGRSVAAGSAITVVPPLVPATLATTRVPVQSASTSVAYIKDAAWADLPNRLFRDLLATTITSRTGHATLDQRQYALSPGPRLGGRLAAFGIDAPSMTARVTYEATLEREGQPLLTRRFEATAPVASIDAAGAAQAIGQAANQVAAEVADWVR